MRFREMAWGVLVGWTVASLFMAGAAYAVGQGVYWVFWQPDPQITAREIPWTNTGYDDKGRAMNQIPDLDRLTWMPVQRSTFKPGETMFTMRHDCFLFKVSGNVTRAFKPAGPMGQTWFLPAMPVPSRTEGCARRNFATPIPPDLPPGEYVYEVAVLFYKNPIQPEVRTKFPDVTVQVVK